MHGTLIIGGLHGACFGANSHLLLGFFHLPLKPGPGSHQRQVIGLAGPQARAHPAHPDSALLSSTVLCHFSSETSPQSNKMHLVWKRDLIALHHCKVIWFGLWSIRENGSAPCKEGDLIAAELLHFSCGIKKQVDKKMSCWFTRGTKERKAFLRGGAANNMCCLVFTPITREGKRGIFLFLALKMLMMGL